MVNLHSHGPRPTTQFSDHIATHFYPLFLLCLSPFNLFSLFSGPDIPMSEKAVAFAEANVTAGFELAQRLLQAKDPQEMGAVYQGHLKEQMEKMSAQFRELGNLASKPAPVDLNK